MYLLTDISKATGIKPINLRQRIYRGTLLAIKKGGIWTINNRTAERFIKKPSMQGRWRKKK